MQITKKRLKEIIAEEMEKLNESNSDRGSTHGQTYRAAQGFDALGIKELVEALEGTEDLRKKVIVAGVTAIFPELVKKIQPPREFDIIKAFNDVASKKDDGGAPKKYWKPHPHAGMDGPPIQKEAYTRTKKRDK